MPSNIISSPGCLNKRKYYEINRDESKWWMIVWSLKWLIILTWCSAVTSRLISTPQTEWHFSLPEPQDWGCVRLPQVQSDLENNVNLWRCPTALLERSEDLTFVSLWPYGSISHSQPEQRLRLECQSGSGQRWKPLEVDLGKWLQKDPVCWSPTEMNRSHEVLN